MRKIIQPWWIRKQIALTVARLPSWGLRCCRPKEPLSEPRRGEFRRRAANRRANRTGNAACQEIVFESSWRYIFYKIISMAFIFTFTQTSAITFYFTVTLILTFLLPDFTVIVTFPDFFAFTTPFEETVTTFLWKKCKSVSVEMWVVLTLVSVLRWSLGFVCLFSLGNHPGICRRKIAGIRHWRQIANCHHGT